MKKLLLFLLLAMIMLSCDDAEPSLRKHKNTRFVDIERTPAYSIVYDKETLVMYIRADGAYSHGVFTLLVDADGKPLTYKID